MGKNILEEIAAKNAGYETIKRERDSQQATYDAKVAAVKAVYGEKQRAVQDKYMQDINSIEAEEKKELDQIRKVVLSSEAVDELQGEVQAIIDQNMIDHNTMCSLLIEKTGKIWLPKIVTGLAQDWEFGGQMSRYGVMLVNEDHEGFNSQVLSYSVNEHPMEDKNAIIAKIGAVWPVNERYAYQHQANNFNWLLVYLEAKGVLPSYEDPAHVPTGGEYRKIILSAIEELLNGKSKTAMMAAGGAASEDEEENERG